MWQKSIHSDMYASLPPPEHSGWTKDGETYGIDWEATDVMNKVMFAAILLLFSSIISYSISFLLSCISVID